MVNKVFLIGRLTRDPEIRILPSGTEVASTGIAVTRHYRHNNELKEETYFFEIEEYGENKKLKSLSKGDKVHIEGHLRMFKTEKGSYVRIVVERTEVLKRKQQVAETTETEEEQELDTVEF